MKEPARFFEEYINQLYSPLTVTARCTHFQVIFVINLFSESTKRRINEGHEGLAVDAAMALIEAHSNDFHKCMQDRGTTLYWQQKDYEAVARQIAEVLPEVKNGVVEWLFAKRNRLFEESFYKEHLPDVTFEEHPMKTFVYWLDYIENLKGTPDFKRWFDVKRIIVNLMRVGNATLLRSEWQGKVTIS